MATLTPGTTVTVNQDGDGFRLTSGGEAFGRIRGSEVQLDDLTLTVRRTGQRSELVTGTGVPALRFDPAGRKATTLTTASARFRLARQRPRPLLHRWRLTRDVHGTTVLTVMRTPLGVRLRVEDTADVHPAEVTLLVVGALVQLLEVEPAAAAA